MKRALVLLLLMLPACGGGDDAKKDYLAKAEAACKKANEQLAEARRQTPTTPQAIPAYVDRLLAIARGTTETFASLDAPADDRADIEAKVVRPLQDQLAEGEKFAAEVKRVAASGDQAKLFALVTDPPTDTKADVAFMREYGFDECAKAADTGSTAQ